MSTTNNTLLFLLPLIAYFIGSIPTAVWVGKIFFKTDIRQHGSGNAGATNTIRVLGWKPGIAVLIFDILKGWFTVSIIGFVYLPGLTADQGVYYQILLGLLVVLGHIFPVFAGFRGGKGVATLLGVGIALYPVTVWIVLAVFIFVLTASGYVSLGSVIAGMSLPFIDIIWMHQQHTGLIVLAIVIGIMLPVTHRKNIKRLIQGQEKKTLWRK